MSRASSPLIVSVARIYRSLVTRPHTDCRIRSAACRAIHEQQPLSPAVVEQAHRFGQGFQMGSEWFRQKEDHIDLAASCRRKETQYPLTAAGEDNQKFGVI